MARTVRLGMERLETREMPAVLTAVPMPRVIAPVLAPALVAPARPAGEASSLGFAASAQADGRVQWRYQNDRGTGYFERNSNGAWIERQPGGGVCTFSETQRTADFIEIYDPSRGQVWVRMYANISYWKHPQLTGGQWRTLWAGSWIGNGTTPSVPQDTTRVKWEYRNDRGTGHFERNSNGTWIERMPSGGVCYFTETHRTADYIELYDPSRGQVWVRMYANISYWKHPQLTGGQWRTLWTGSWVQTASNPDPGRGIGNPPASITAEWVIRQLRGSYNGHFNGSGYDYTRSKYVNAHIPMAITIDTAQRRGNSMKFDISGRFGSWDRNQNQYASVGGVIISYTYKGTFTVDLAGTRSSGQLKGWWDFDARQYKNGKLQARMYANGMGLTLSGGKVLAGEATIALTTYVNGRTTFNSNGLKAMIEKTASYN